MPAHGRASGSEPVLARPFEALTRFVVRFPVFVLAAALVLGGLSLYLTYTRLSYKTSRLDLVDLRNDYNRRWVEYIREFGEAEDAVVVVEGPSRERVVAALNAMNAQLARHTELFQSVLHEVDLAKVRAKGLHYLRPDDVAGLEMFVAQVEPIVGGDWSRLSLARRAGELAGRLQHFSAKPGPELGLTLREVEQTAATLAASLAGRPANASSWSGTPDALATLAELSQQHILMNDGKLGVLLLHLVERDKTSFVPGNEAVTTLRRLAAETMGRYPDVKIGLTGMPIMENDEMRASQASMTWASLVSLVGVAALFVAGFGGLRHAILANLVLLLGMAWSFGYVTLAVGHLNILSVSFTVTLIGIGIDYGVHFVSRYLQVRGAGTPCADALVATARGISPAITTGAVTTAVAFYAAGFTSFVGIAELGIIAGGGILLCAAAMVVVLPAVIVLFEGREGKWTPPRPLETHKWVNAPLRWPRRSLALVAVACVLVSTGLPKVAYDNNLLNMQADGLESVELEHKLLNECKQSSWFALSIADSREELLARKAKFLELPTVERTEEIVSLLPESDVARSAAIARIRERLARLPERPPLVAVERPEAVGHALGALQQVAAAAPGGASAAAYLEEARAQLRRLSLADCYTRIAQYQQQAAGELLTRLHALSAMSDPTPPKLEDLPASLVSRFVGQHGRHLLKIYGRGNIWDVKALERFVVDVRSIDPEVTGNPLQAYEATHEMKRSFEEAAVYAAFVIVLVVWLDFRSITSSLLALLPLVLGIVQMFGLMGWLGIPLNPANLIALPLVLGIGIDYGVHIVHEYREQRGAYKMAQSTAVALLVDSLTTIAGFGSLMIANHRGLQSLGRVLTIGVTCCLITSVLLLPPMLRLVSLWRGAKDEDEAPPDDEPSSPPATREPNATLQTPRRRTDAASSPPAPHFRPNVRWVGASSRPGPGKPKSQL